MTDVPIVPMETLLAHAGWMRALARSLVADDARADDVVQETWMTALREPPRAGGSVRAWLASVVRSRAADARKAERRRGEREIAASRPEFAGTGSDPVADGADATEIHLRLTRAVMELAEPYRSAVILRFFEGLPPRDVGARTGVAAETARTRINRGLAMLRERLDAEFGDRRKWGALLLPVLGRGDATGTGGSFVGHAGGLAMATARTYVAAAIGLALLAGIWWWRHDDAAGAAPARTTIEIAERNTVAAPRSVRARPETVESAPPAADAVPDATSAVAAGARVRLRFVDEAGAPLSSQATRARWGGGVAAPSVALFDDRALRSAERSDWLRQSIEGGRASLRPTPVGETNGEFALTDRVPPGRWRLVAFPGAAPSTMTRPFTVAKDGDEFDIDVVLSATAMRLVRVVGPSNGGVVAGARLTPYFEYGDVSATVAGPVVTTDASGEARVAIDDGDRTRSRRPPTWWATAPGGAATFLVRSNVPAGDAPLVVTLEPTCDVEGDAVLTDGAPAAGRTVSWSGRGMNLNAICDASGHFRLAGVPAGAPQQQIILMEDAARGLTRRVAVTLMPGGTATMRFDAPSADAARIVVTLTAGGLPVRGMAVTCRRGEGGTMVLTDADGSATLTGLTGGTSPIVVVLLCDPRVAEDFTGASLQAPLAAGEERRLTLDLPVGAIRVRVVGADGLPVPGAHVVARPPQGAGSVPEGWEVKFGDARFVDDDGRALLVGLPTGAMCDVSVFDGVAGLRTSTSVVPGTADAPAELTLVVK